MRTEAQEKDEDVRGDQREIVDARVLRVAPLVELVVRGPCLRTI